MKESHVLVIGLSNCCTELSRHLILSGINLQIVSLKKGDTLKVQPDDFLDDYLFAQDDTGKSKGNVVVQKLSEMNPFSSISYEELEVGEGSGQFAEKLREFLKLKKYSAVVYGLQSSFKEAIEVNEVTWDLQLPFYCINASGLNAFFFSDLATDNFEFTHKKKDADGNEI